MYFLSVAKKSSGDVLGLAGYTQSSGPGELSNKVSKALDLKIQAENMCFVTMTMVAKLS